MISHSIVVDTPSPVPFSFIYTHNHSRVRLVSTASPAYRKHYTRRIIQIYAYSLSLSLSFSLTNTQHTHTHSLSFSLRFPFLPSFLYSVSRSSFPKSIRGSRFDGALKKISGGKRAEERPIAFRHHFEEENHIPEDGLPSVSRVRASAVQGTMRIVRRISAGRR